MQRIDSSSSFGALVMVICLAGSGLSQVYLDRSASADERADDLMKIVTDDQAINLISYGNIQTGSVKLGWNWKDGPLGPKVGSAVQFPAPSGMSASFDDSLMNRVGWAMGRIANESQPRTFLAPGVNLQRLPTGGRNFEYYSEDPYLSAGLAAASIRGIQEWDVIACAKHFAANNQEYGRHNYSVYAGKRVLRELYLPGFEGAVREGGSMSIMAAYNSINGTYCSDNVWLLDTVLRKDWGFKGFVCSDWQGLHSPTASLIAGCDLNFDSKRHGAEVMEAVSSGAVTMDRVRELARNIIYAMIKQGFLDRTRGGSISAAEKEDLYEIARKASESGIVMLKNAGSALPLDPSTITKLAVIGRHAKMDNVGSAGGSADMGADNPIGYYQGIVDRLGDSSKVVYADGYDMTDGRWYESGASLAARIAEAVEAARSADAAVVFVGWNKNYEGEGNDRLGIQDPVLPRSGARNKYDLFSDNPDSGYIAPLVKAIAAVNQRTIVVTNTGGAVDARGWIDDADAWLHAWYGGERRGAALAPVLFGDVSPGGRLPLSFPAKIEDYPIERHFETTAGMLFYSERLDVGYRHYDRAATPYAAFPFGFGLTYTTFEYSNMSLTPRTSAVDTGITVTFTVTNTGTFRAAAVPQLYVAPVNPPVDRPVKELKGYRRVMLDPGAAATVALPLNHRSFSYYDTTAETWVAAAGDYRIQIGTSSLFPRDLELEETFALTQTVQGDGPIHGSGSTARTAVRNARCGRGPTASKAAVSLLSSGGRLMILNRSKEPVTVAVVDSRGRLVREVVTRGRTMTVDSRLLRCAPGTYIVSAAIKGELRRGRVILR